MSQTDIEQRYRFLLAFLIEKGVLTNQRYSNGTWVLRGVYGVDDSGIKGAGLTPEQAIDNAIIANQLDPAAASKFWQKTHEVIASEQSSDKCLDLHVFMSVSVAQKYEELLQLTENMNASLRIMFDREKNVWFIEVWKFGSRIRFWSRPPSELEAGLTALINSFK